MPIDLIEDQVIAGRLRIINKIASGGFGQVYKAWDPQLERVVAVKLLNMGGCIDQEGLDRFLREAKISSALLHKNIVRTYSYGLLNDVTPYLVLEYVEGTSLEQVLNEHDKLAAAQAVEIVLSVLDALDYAHQQGVVHRDIKPANILLTPDLTSIKIADFGLARRYEVDSTLTKTGFVQGTPQFMSPEQISGGVVDGRSDLYAVACMLCLMLSGRLPFTSVTELGFLYEHVHSDPQLPRLPVVLAKAILRALEKNPDARFGTAGEFAENLQRSAANPNSLTETLIAPKPKSRLRLPDAGVLCVVALLMVFGVAMLLRSPEKNAEQSEKTLDFKTRNLLIQRLMYSVNHGYLADAVQALRELRPDPSKPLDTPSRELETAITVLKQRIKNSISDKITAADYDGAKQLAELYCFTDSEPWARAAVWSRVTEIPKHRTESAEKSISYLRQFERPWPKNVQLSYNDMLLVCLFDRIDQKIFDAETQRLADLAAESAVADFSSETFRTAYFQAKTMQAEVVLRRGDPKRASEILDAIVVPIDVCRKRAEIGGFYTVRYDIAEVLAKKGNLKGAYEQVDKLLAVINTQKTMEEFSLSSGAPSTWYKRFKAMAPRSK
jgi:serine/threonine protein kinase